MVQVMIVAFLNGSQEARWNFRLPKVVVSEVKRQNEAEEEHHAGEFRLPVRTGDASEAPADLGFPGKFFIRKKAGEHQRERVLAHPVLVDRNDGSEEEQEDDALDDGDAAAGVLDEHLASHVRHKGDGERVE